MKKVEKSIELGGRKLTLKTGVLAGQATGAVLASYGDTVVLATVVSSPPKMDLGYFPLFVEYQERLYAGGRIKGSRWVKREGRPTDEEILTARLIDRSIRPLFPKDYKEEVQVMVMVLSVDLESDPSILSAIAASAALAASPIPWKGPVGVVNVGLKDGKYSTNVLKSQKDDSELDLVVSATKDAIVMIEAGAKEVPEDKILGGIEYALGEIKSINGLIEDLAKAVGAEKAVVESKKVSPELVKQIEKLAKAKIPSIIDKMNNFEGGRSMEYEELIKAVQAQVTEEERSLVYDILEDIKKHIIRDMILGGKRPDGRKLDEVRPLSAEVGILPRVHGSALFSRGTTQVLSVATLGAPSMGQLIETAEGEEEKRYMHHYSMPPYSTGEVGRVGSPNRREIGHGALAERALEPVLPSLDVFPYAIRIVSEVMSSNGSTSMASVVGSTLSLMDAGVPLTGPVSGIAMGLILESDKKYAVLSDIAGIEDFNGDMDFKVAGTQKGVTALQLDVKTLNLTLPILKDALAQAKKARELIMDKILETLPEARKAVSTHAPKIKVVKVPVEKIGEVIGPGGRVIKKIIAETGAQVEVSDDGSVNISSPNEESMNKAVTWVENLVKEVQAGEIYEGTVVRIQPFGAFVEVLPGKDGMVHVSDMGEGFVADPNDVVKIGDKVQVRVKEIDSLGRINLSMRMDPSKDQPREERGSTGGGRGFGDRGRSGGGRSFSPRSGGARSGGFRGGGDRGGERRFGDRGTSSGPHFPTSRYMDPKKKSFDR